MSTLLCQLDIAFAVAPIPRWDDRDTLTTLADRHLVGEERRLFALLRSDKRRAAFLAGRIAAKKLLIAPPFSFSTTATEIGRRSSGAPYIKGMATPTLSISHTDGIAVAVAAAKEAIGIDIETDVRRDAALITYFFSQGEKQLLNGLEEPSRSALANVLWTRKEAAAKVGEWGGALVFRHLDCSHDHTVIDNRRIRLKSASLGGFVASIAIEEETVHG